MFTFGGRTSGTTFGRSFGDLVVSPGAAGAASFDAAFVLNFFGVVEEGLEEAFFGPFMFTHEDGGSGGGDIEDIYDYDNESGEMTEIM